ncbi:MAG: acyloxyacyl hydrolase [Saprospiraceae bacterium]|nr:acyloxyacyl hydrolase [Candidatus Brachybacter algidus]
MIHLLIFVLGSRFNATSIIDLGFSFDKGSNSDIKSGILISHISNGNLVSPILRIKHLKYLYST